MKNPQTCQSALLYPDEPPPYEIVNPDGCGRIILVCDHASNRIPRRLGTLGVDPGDRQRHVAWDIGAAAVARGLSAMLDAPLALAGYSRLVIDCNRPLHVDDLFTTRSEDVEVPGNVGLTDADRICRIDALFWPYQDAVHRLVESRLGGERPCVMVSVHSFTPVYFGQTRPWNIGVHYRCDDRLARLAIESLSADQNLSVGENDPYPVALDEDYTVPVHAEARGLPYVLFEIRQDQLMSKAGIAQWTQRLCDMLSKMQDDPSLDYLAEPATDVHEPRYAQED